MTDSNVIHINEVEEFDKLANSKSKLVVKFSAEWCAPCRSLAPIIEEMSTQEFPNIENLKFVDVNIDNIAELATRFRIKGIPTVLFISENEVIKEKVGMSTKEELIELIKAAFEQE